MNSIIDCFGDIITITRTEDGVSTYTRGGITVTVPTGPGADDSALNTFNAMSPG